MKTKAKAEISSMPAKPALGRSQVWSRKLRRQCEYRFVLVGFIDAPAEWMLFGSDEENVLSQTPSAATAWGIDGPEQIIKIGPKVQFPKGR